MLLNYHLQIFPVQYDQREFSLIAFEPSMLGRIVRLYPLQCHSVCAIGWELYGIGMYMYTFNSDTVIYTCREVINTNFCIYKCMTCFASSCIEKCSTLLQMLENLKSILPTLDSESSPPIKELLVIWHSHQQHSTP